MRPHVLALSTLVVSCALLGRGHAIDFSPLERADRLIVRNRAGDTVKTITDLAQVHAAAEFIQAYRSGWQDPLRGSLMPDYMLYFYSGTSGLGAYGRRAGAQ